MQSINRLLLTGPGQCIGIGARDLLAGLGLRLSRRPFPRHHLAYATDCGRNDKGPRRPRPRRRHVCVFGHK